MIVIDRITEIIVPAGYSEYEICADHAVDLRFRASAGCEVFLKVTKAGSIRLHTVSDNGAAVTYLIWNEVPGAVVFNETHEVYGNTKLSVAYGEVDQGESVRTATVELMEEGAEADVSSATLAAVEKSYHLKVTSRAPHTNGNMRNYAVILKDGRFLMDAAGAIEKGARVSESHQTSRALCFDDTMAATIIPALLIDENDVKASHAASVGRVDEEQLYYLQSRGLSINDCMRLISTGYLMPITDTISDERLRETLKKELEEKIAAIC